MQVLAISSLAITFLVIGSLEQLIISSRSQINLGGGHGNSFISAAYIAWTGTGTKDIQEAVELIYPALNLRRVAAVAFQ
jgi:hypothetical protein